MINEAMQSSNPAHVRIAETNDQALPLFYSNQVAMLNLLADLAYPLQRFIPAVVATGMKMDKAAQSEGERGNGFSADLFERESLQKDKPSAEGHNRTGSGTREPVLTVKPLRYLAWLCMRLDEARDSQTRYAKEKTIFVNNFMRAFGYVVIEAILRHLVNAPVKDCGLSPAAQLDARRKLKAMERMNEDLRLSLLRANEPLIINSASSFFRYYEGRVGHEDLLNLGRIGLLDAISRFSPAFGKNADDECSLGGVGTFWIKQHIRRYCQDHSGTVKIPVATQSMLNKVNSVRKRNAEATDGEVAEMLVARRHTKNNPAQDALLNVDPERVLVKLRSTAGWDKAVDSELAKIKNLHAIPKVTSIENQSADGTDYSLLNSLDAAHHETPAANVTVSDSQEILQRVTSKLPCRDRTILSFSFGLTDAKATAAAYLHDTIQRSAIATSDLLVSRPKRQLCPIEVLDGLPRPAN